jgi:hypothetical protein
MPGYAVVPLVAVLSLALLPFGMFVSSVLDRLTGRDDPRLTTRRLQWVVGWSTVAVVNLLLDGYLLVSTNRFVIAGVVAIIMGAVVASVSLLTRSR